MTAADLYNDAWGRVPAPQPGFYSFTEDNWRRDPRSNPMLMPASSDQEMMAWNKVVSDRSRELLNKNQAARARRQAQLLQSMLERPEVNLFDRPTNDAELQTQRLVQQRINAEQRGLSAMTSADKMNRQRAKEDLDRAKSIQDLRLKNEGFALSRKAQAQADEDRDYGLRLREQNQKETQKQKKAAADQQSFLKEQGLLDQDYRRALQLIESGANPKDLIAAYPRLGPEHFTALDALAKAINEHDWRGYEQIKGAAEDYSNRLQSELQRVTQDIKDPAQAAARKDSAAKTFMLQNAKNLAGLTYDPNNYAFAPNEAPPAEYDPLDVAMLQQRRGQSNQPAYQFGQSFMPTFKDGLPVILNPSDLDRYSDYQQVLTPDGRKVMNTRYRPGMAVQRGNNVMSRNIAPMNANPPPFVPPSQNFSGDALDRYYYGWR